MYEVVQDGPGWGSPGCTTDDRHLTLRECQQATLVLGYNRHVVVLSTDTSLGPKGCFVDILQHITYFSYKEIQNDYTVRSVSICLKGGKCLLYDDIKQSNLSP